MDKVEFFIVEQNTLNNEWMVYSKCEQLNQCFHYPKKKDAEDLCVMLNNSCLKTYYDVPFKLIWSDVNPKRDLLIKELEDKRPEVIES